MSGTATRKDRLNVRLDHPHKVLIERAASASGQSLTQFALSHLIRDARTILAEQEATVLSQRDSQLFLSLLDANAQPNEALKKAAKTYRRQRA